MMLRTSQIAGLFMLGLVLVGLVVWRLSQRGLASPFGNTPAMSRIEPPSLVAPLASPTTSQRVPTSPASPTTPLSLVRINLGAFPDTFDPQRVEFDAEIAHLRLIYEGLTRFDAQLHTIPAAAVNWHYNSNATQLIFTLREGLTYSDGVPLTAHHFAYALARNCEPGMESSHPLIAAELDKLVGCRAARLTDPTQVSEETRHTLRAGVGISATPDGRQLTLSFLEPAPFFHSVAALWVAYPVRQELVTAEPRGAWSRRATAHSGNGPFRWETLEPNRRSVFVPNPAYHGGVPSVIIEYGYEVDQTKALAAYEAGWFDIIPLDETLWPVIKGGA